WPPRAAARRRGGPAYGGATPGGGRVGGEHSGAAWAAPRSGVGSRNNGLTPLDQLASAALDFFCPRPGLMVVEPESLCWITGRMVPARDGVTWAEELARLPALEAVVRDDGTGLGNTDPGKFLPDLHRSVPGGQDEANRLSSRRPRRCSSP